MGGGGRWGSMLLFLTCETSLDSLVCTTSNADRRLVPYLEGSHEHGKRGLLIIVLREPRAE